MKKYCKALCLILAVALIGVIFAGCNKADDGVFSYSDSLTSAGHWEGVKALNYVTLPDYVGLEIPADVTTVSDETLQEQIDSYLAKYPTKFEITDRAVADGDKINLDYVGSIDGVEFDGGSTKGAGSEVTIGVTNFIDDFLEQLIGHMPGENFDIEVTFPDDYSEETLQGKDAVFNVTINHIVEEQDATLDDSFVATNLSSSQGWNTVEEMRAGLTESLKSEAINTHIGTFLTESPTFSEIPQSMMDYQVDSMVAYYEGLASSNSMDLETLLTTYMGVASVDALVESNQESLEETVRYHLTIQAIAEDSEMTVEDADVAEYFSTYYQTDDYSEYETAYGMPYLKLIVLCDKVLDFLLENAVEL